MTPTNVQAAIRQWPQVASLVTAPRTKGDHRRMVEALDAVLDAGGADEHHPLASLADYMGELIRAYEDRVMPRREIPVGDFLRELLGQHGLKQSEVPEIGSQSLVSDILRGHRQLTAKQIAALSKRFKLPADAFLE